MGLLISVHQQIIWLMHSTPKLPNIILNPDKTVISLNGYSLPISDFPLWYQRRVKSTNKQLDSLLLGMDISKLEEVLQQRLNPKSPMTWFSDDLTNMDRGYSF